MANEDVNRPEQEASAQPPRRPFSPGELEEELIEEEVAPKPAGSSAWRRGFENQPTHREKPKRPSEPALL
jgi:hypothetical protein